MPGNTDFPIGVLTSYETMKTNPDIYGYTTRWGMYTSSFQSFMLLPKNVSIESDKQAFTRIQ